MTKKEVIEKLNELKESKSVKTPQEMLDKLGDLLSLVEALESVEDEDTCLTYELYKDIKKDGTLKCWKEYVERDRNKSKKFKDFHDNIPEDEELDDALALHMAIYDSCKEACNFSMLSRVDVPKDVDTSFEINLHNDVLKNIIVMMTSQFEILSYIIKDYILDKEDKEDE